jgi:hypothetical protein
VGEVVEVVRPASAAFAERLQSSLSFARKCLIAAQQRQKALANKRRVDQDYKVGDKVLLSTKYLNLKHSESSRKLLPKWIGPFEVVQVVGPVAYKLKMNPGWRVHPVFHVSLLEPYREDGQVVTIGVLTTGPRSQKACYDVHLTPNYYTCSDSDPPRS